MGRLTLSGTANCNFKYISNLRGWKPEKAIFDMFGSVGSPFRKGAVTYLNPTYAILLFAQGSEDKVTDDPYAPNLAKFIKKYKLGGVWTTGDAPNAQHNNKPGILFMWKLDRTALKQFITKCYSSNGKFTPPKVQRAPRKVANVSV